jgi:hypothetical protein
MTYDVTVKGQRTSGEQWLAYRNGRSRETERLRKIRAEGFVERKLRDRRERCFTFGRQRVCFVRFSYFARSSFYLEMKMNHSVKQSAQSFTIPERTLVWLKVLTYCSFLLLIRVAFRWSGVGGIGGLMVTGRKLKVLGRKPVPVRRCPAKPHMDWFRIESSCLRWGGRHLKAIARPA